MTIAARTRLGPYEILAPLGAGGMGEVYRAKDTKLDREVALKVLSAHLEKNAGALARFEREAKAVAALSHPNILSIFDFGAQDGTTYAVTELLEGETLREKLAAGRIPQRQAMDYAVQIANGLSAAHEKGIVHRDLKPENVFVERNGRVKILDFGLARRDVAVGPDEVTSAPTVEGHTEPGTVMGTVGYMSPEQVRGLPADHRCDIFSFGTILYEMLSRESPFRRATAGDTMAAILRDEPSDLTASVRGISPALERIVRHCLAKDREQRFQSAADIAFALSGEPQKAGPALPETTDSGRNRALVATIIVVALATAALLLMRRRPVAPTDAATIRRVAVLPFENVGNPEDDYFADGIADEVRSKLTALPGIEVIARASSTPYKKTTKTPEQIARELDVGYLLTATVRWQKGAGAGRVHVTPELVEVKASGAPTSRWQQPFDAALTDVFQVQSDIATRVAEGLGVELGSGAEKHLAERPTQNVAAYDAFLKGQDVWKGLAVGDPVGVRKALGFYEQAVALDPGFAQAWARISWGSSSLYTNSSPTPELEERARAAAEKAIALAPDRPEGYHALGNYRRLVLNDANGALEQYAKGRRLDPRNADILTASALAYELLGHWDRAMEELREAERFDPRSVPTRLRLGEAFLRLRRYGEAREAFDRGLALAPSNLTLLEQKAMTFLAVGDLAGARAVLASAPKDVEPTALVAYVAANYDLSWVLSDEQRELLLRLTPAAFDGDRMIWTVSLLEASDHAGDTANVRRYAEEARKALEEQLRVRPTDGLRRAYLGLALACLGDKTGAIREAEQATTLAGKDGSSGPFVRHLVSLVYLHVNEPAKALDLLEPLLEEPYVLTPGWLTIDPSFDPLRNNPRFQKLATGAK
jgi:serine/threonine protein kinase/tetratricopeptide (TPR) repeat protein